MTFSAADDQVPWGASGSGQHPGLPASVPHLTEMGTPLPEDSDNSGLPLARPFVLDIGGEGRHPQAWNLNPSRRKTIGPQRGAPIPRLIQGRGDAIPLPDGLVDVVIVERMPLLRLTLAEIRRVARPGATVILRHARPPWSDPHRLAAELLPGARQQTTAQIGRHAVQETVIQLQPNRAESSDGQA